MSVQQSGNDVLFEIRNSFFIGNIQHCINEAQKAKLSNKRQQMEKDIYMYRAYIAQRKYGVVIDEINHKSGPALAGVRMLAMYLSGDANNKAKIVASLEDKMKEVSSEDSLSQFLLLMGGTIYFLEENYDAVLKLFYNTELMEGCALVIQTYLKIHRLDLAQKELNKMKEFDEDCTITQLCQAWLNLSRGGDKLQDAFYIFQELTDKYTTTPLLLNGQASALIALGKYEEAEPLLQEALDKDPNSPETLINMTVISQLLGKSIEVSCRYLNQLKDTHRHHPFVREYQSKEEEFERLVRQYAPTTVSTA